jgi:hypothetical protein
MRTRRSARDIAVASVLLILAGFLLWGAVTTLSAPALDLTCMPGRRRGFCEAGFWVLRLFDPDVHRPLLSAVRAALALMCVYVAARLLGWRPTAKR